MLHGRWSNAQKKKKNKKKKKKKEKEKKMKMMMMMDNDDDAMVSIIGINKTSVQSTHKYFK